MSQISGIRLEKETEERMYKIFWGSLAGLKKVGEVEAFFSELLTPTEKVMLAKRLAIATLLMRGHDYRSISFLLKVSFSTIFRVKALLEQSEGGYRKVIEKMLRKQAWKELLKDFEKTLFDLHAYKKHPDNFRKKGVL